MAKAKIDAAPVLEAAEDTLDKIEKFLDTVDAVADKGTDVVEAGLEKAVDVVPEALDATVHVSTSGGRKLVRFFRDPRHAAISVVILAGVAGAGLGVAGYYMAVKRLKAKMQAEYDEQLESEIAEMRRFYELRHKDGKFATPASAVEELLPPEVARTIQSYQGTSAEPSPVQLEGSAEVYLGEELTPEDQEAVLRDSGYTDKQISDVLGGRSVAMDALQEKMKAGEPVEVAETTNNIFLDGRPVEEFDYAAEVAKRDPETPYVITHDEFMENENGWTQAVLTYYNGDDVLTDDQDMPIPDIEAIVDSENLSKFGYGSRDKNVVYVRNEKIETDFEITLSQGEFSKEVGGFNELKHSAPMRRFRGDDE